MVSIILIAIGLVVLSIALTSLVPKWASPLWWSVAALVNYAPCIIDPDGGNALNIAFAVVCGLVAVLQFIAVVILNSFDEDQD